MVVLFYFRCIERNINAVDQHLEEPQYLKALRVLASEAFMVGQVI